MTERILANLLLDRKGANLAVTCNCRMIQNFTPGDCVVVSSLVFPCLTRVEPARVLSWVRENLPQIKPGGYFLINKNVFYAVKHV
jgi:hypothetical protein